MANLFQKLQLRDLEQRCEATPCTRGMKVRVRGAVFTLYREVSVGGASPQPDERLRFTQVSVHRYEISVLLHTGRWERTGVVGTLDELFEAVDATMQHVVRDWSKSAGQAPSGSSPKRKRT